MSSREINQRRADTFDLDLSRLSNTADAYSASSNGASWRVIRNALDAIRPEVRAMMSDERRAETSGSASTPDKSQGSASV